jgi:hypothetical protein
MMEKAFMNGKQMELLLVSTEFVLLQQLHNNECVSLELDDLDNFLNM